MERPSAVWGTHLNWITPTYWEYPHLSIPETLKKEGLSEPYLVMYHRMENTSLNKYFAFLNKDNSWEKFCYQLLNGIFSLCYTHILSCLLLCSLPTEWRILSPFYRLENWYWTKLLEVWKLQIQNRIKIWFWRPVLLRCVHVCTSIYISYPAWLGKISKALNLRKKSLFFI